MSRQILLDDERFFIDELAHYLLAQGHEVTCACDAKEFRLAMATHSFGLTIDWLQSTHI